MKSVAEKLGYRAGRVGWMLEAPEKLRNVIGLPTVAPAGDCDLILAFARDQSALTGMAATVLPIYKRGGSLWFAHPKKSGAIRSDLSRDAGWDVVTAAGLIPVTQIALDDDWSALRFRYRDEVKLITRKEG